MKWSSDPKPDGVIALDAAAHRCLNCGVRAPDAYCPACGQSTRDRLPTFAQFMREAMGRYVAYDGKFWKTLAALMFRPGFLTREYLAGRRRRYIGPARLFLVSSLVLFATLRLATESINFGDVVQIDPPKEPKAGVEVPKGKVEAPQGRARPGELVTLDDDLNLNMSELAGSMGILRKPVARFNALPRTQKVEQIVAGTLRYGPYAMFVLLPAFAALLKVLYLGPRRRHPSRPRLYGEHLVFAAHNHAFLFVVGSLMGVTPNGWMTGALMTLALVYLVWSMRSVYGGRWLGIAARAMVLVVAYAILFAFVTIGLLVAAVLLH